ncbi:MAG: hypothetical protein A2085_00205 [Gemmatimonadetes bacterium GWC2_71_10]|nr:MAG: hypothetical protein A2085_00205 [Gemmatimonadetes bacterium GWC2_71_10]
MRLSLLVGLMAIAAGIVLALALPREREVRLTFAADSVVVGRQGRSLPSRIELDPDRRYRLRIVNRTAEWRYAGVVAVPAGESTLVTLDQCIPPGGTPGLVQLR